MRSVFKLGTTNYKFVKLVLIRATSSAAETYTEQDLKLWKEIPGPSSLPIIGQLCHFLPGGSLYGPMGLEFQNRLVQQYGPVVRIDGLLGAPAMVFVFNAEAAGQVLREEDSMPSRPGFKSLEYYRKVYSRNKNDPTDKPTGLITENGEMWKNFRSIVNPIMLKPKSIKIYTKTLDEVALDMVARLKTIRHDKNRIQNCLDQELNLWALEAISVLALGQRLNCLEVNLPEDSQAKRLIKVVNDIFSSLDKLDLKPGIWEYIWTPAYKQAMKTYDEQKIISKSFIAKAIEQLQRKDQQSDDEMSVIEKLLDIDENAAVVMASDMLFVGIDTTTNTMISILYFLAINPEKQDKLRKEIITNQERRPYLKACIKESLRMRPIISYTMRKLSKDRNILGYRVPKNMHVMTGNSYLCLLEEHYPRPHEYIPERWTAEKDDPLYHGNAHPFAYSPFGFGIRSCIGRRIAELELETFLARMIENFQIEWFGPPLKIRPTLLNYAASPYNFIINDVNKVATSSAAETYAEQDLKSWKEIPGPSSLPIIGQLCHFLPGGSLYGPMGLEFQNRMVQQYGPVVRIDGLLGAPAMVFVFNAEAAGQVLREEDLMPSRPGFKSLEYYRKVYSRNKNDPIDKPTGLITENGEMWKNFRSIVNPILLKPKSIKIYTKILDEVALDMVARLKTTRHDKNRIQNSFDQELNLWALEAMSVVALGQRLNCLEVNLPQDSHARRLIKVINNIVASLEKLDLKPGVWKYIWTPAYEQAMKTYEEQKMISKSFIAKALEQLPFKDQQSDDEKSVLEKLLEIDENAALVMASDMLFVGIDTATNTMISILYFLASHPEKQDKLRKEIMTNQERRPYLKACIKESLRIRPIISYTMRKLSKDRNILGYRVPKDMHIMTGNNYLCLLEEHYPRPHEYIPERWTAEKDDPLYHGNAHPFAYSPFGFGIRSCVGRRIAELELETFLARMIENFQLEWFGPPLKIRPTLVNYAASPYNFIMNDVNKM